MQGYALTLAAPVQVTNIMSGFEVDTAVERVFLNISEGSSVKSMIDWDAGNVCCLPDELNCTSPCRADCRFYSPGEQLKYYSKMELTHG